MKRIRKKMLFGMIVTMAMLFVGCGKKEERSDEVTIGYFNNITHAQALLMKTEGMLEKSLGKGIKVKWTAFNAGPAEVEALFSGDIDIGYIGPVPAISANVKSWGDISILTGATKGGAVLVKRKGSNINSVKDLSGKVVAIPQIGNTQHLTLLKLLADHGLKPTTEDGDVTVAAVSNADVGNTMERGDIDAALVPEPWGTTLLQKNAELVLDYDEVYAQGNYDVAVVVVRKDFQEANPEMVKKFLEQHEAATVLINNEKEDCIKKINSELDKATGKSLPLDVIHTSFEKIGVRTDVNKEAILQFANICKQQKFMRKMPDENLFVNK